MVFIIIAVFLAGFACGFGLLAIVVDRKRNLEREHEEFVERVKKEYEKQEAEKNERIKRGTVS